MKILIVDDSAVIRRKIERELLVDQIKEVYQASNGVEAVKLYKEHKPDMVTMDLTMPEMDGVECVKKILEIRKDAMILVISALSDKSTAIQAIKNGAMGFICKPFTDKDLNDALLQMLEDRKNRMAS